MPRLGTGYNNYTNIRSLDMGLTQLQYYVFYSIPKASLLVVALEAYVKKINTAEVSRNTHNSQSAFPLSKLSLQPDRVVISIYHTVVH
jgi:hypothetical protein